MVIDKIFFLIIVILKIFLFPTNQSTDFEVHRNWKAITNSLQISEWYFYSDNKWTLDYPPLFSYMEYILGKFSNIFDQNITNLEKFNYNSNVCKIYMRATVLLGDFFLFFSIKFFSKNINMSLNKYLILIFSVQFYAGLVLIDNIHFQYNGILFGLFFISLGFIAKKKYIYGAIFYSICLNMKHTFIYFAPAYLIFYFKYIIINNIKKKNYKKLLTNAFLIGIGFCTVLLISFLPFIVISIKEHNFSQLIQIKNRLFPVQRGLLHTYWAPNFWALYSFTDKLLYFVHSKSSKKCNIIEKICNFFLQFKNNLNNIGKKNISSLGASDNGVSQETGFDILPDIDMKKTNIIIVTFILIYYMKYFYQNKNIKKSKIKNMKIKEFIKHCIISNFIFFNFGYQVHEKAFLNISILTLIYYILSLDKEDKNIFDEKKEETKNKKQSDALISLSFIIVIIGILAQMPLIHEPKDYLVKIGISITYIVIIKAIVFKGNYNNSSFIIKIIIISFIIFSLILDFYATFQKYFDYEINFKPILELKKIKENYPFLFLMLFSVLNGVFTQIILILLFIF